MRHIFTKNTMPKEELLESFYSGLFEDKKPLRIDGQVMGYMSRELNEELIKVINENPKFTSMVKQKFAESIKKRKIMPVYNSETFVGDIVDTFTFIFRAMSGVYLGFYDGKRIVLAISNLRGLSGDIAKHEIYDILTHEHQHKFASEDKSYYQHPGVKAVLKDWYSYFIDNYFGKLKPVSKDELMFYFTNIKLESTLRMNPYMDKRSKDFEKVLNRISEKEPSKANRCQTLYDYTYDSYSGIDATDQTPFRVGMETYRHLGVASRTWIYQEFLVPSEVICVVAAGKPLIGNKLLDQFL